MKNDPAMHVKSKTVSVTTQAAGSSPKPENNDANTRNTDADESSYSNFLVRILFLKGFNSTIERKRKLN